VVFTVVMGFNPTYWYRRMSATAFGLAGLSAALPTINAQLHFAGVGTALLIVESTPYVALVCVFSGILLAWIDYKSRHHGSGGENIHIASDHGHQPTKDEMLRTLLDHTEKWYNEITRPLKELLFEMLTDKTAMRPERYVEIARELYWNIIESNEGNYLKNTMEQMDSMPFFTSKDQLLRLTKDFLKSGRFVKDFATESFSNWDERSPEAQEARKKEARENWEHFRACKEKLVAEINRQIGKLG
jgi:hypothetical protein